MQGRVDLAVVGAGIVGLAVANELVRRRPGIKLVVLEKEPTPASHQTGRNSGVIHSGVYYAPGSLKARLCVEGSRLLYDYCDAHDIRYERCGKLIVSTRESELPRLSELFRRGLANGVPGIEELSGEGLREVEPNVVGIRALLVPGAGIVDFRSVASSLAAQLEAAGATIATGDEVVGLVPSSRGIDVTTVSRQIPARFVVTCGGLHSDRLAALSGAPAAPRIVPFRGGYRVLRSRLATHVDKLVYPVSDPRLPFLGVHLTKRLSGEVWAGPNAFLAFAREGYRGRDVDARDLWETFTYRGFRALALRHWRAAYAELATELSRRRFASELRRFLPAVEPEDLLPGPSGVRAQALGDNGELLDDFWIDRGERALHVRNAPSPAATSSLALARHIADEVAAALAP